MKASTASSSLKFCGAQDLREILTLPQDVRSELFQDLEMPPKEEHQANGRVEEAGRTIRDHARVLKIYLQSKIARELEVDEPIMPWLL